MWNANLIDDDLAPIAWSILVQGWSYDRFTPAPNAAIQL